MSRPSPFMNEREQALRAALSIPQNANTVLIFEQSAHCDWDWMVSHPTYYADGYSNHQPVRTTLENAITNIGAATTDLPYTYVFCEVAWLQDFINDQNVSQETKSTLQSYVTNGTFLFSSGGITSAENLTLHTEAFIRNYLLGRQYLKTTFNADASPQMWIPDDFGHDAQLPVLLQAMGYTGVAFERIPYMWQAAAPTVCGGNNYAPNAPNQFLQQSVGIDFNWQATDGSKVQAHWLLNGYCDGNNLFGTPPLIPTDQGNCDIQAAVTEYSRVPPPTKDPTYLFVPIDCDFTQPYSNFPTIVSNWNANVNTTGVWVVMGSFDQFIQLVASSGDTLPTVYSYKGSPDYPFVPHPYYSGCYGSRPALKSLHYLAVRTLLMAEAMQLLVLTIPSLGSTVESAWQQVLPSTHHDYITGTSPDSVYSGEQLTGLTNALSAADGALQSVLSAVANAIAPAPNANGVAVFNSLGFPRTGVADLASPPAGTFQSTTLDFENYYPIQSDGNGGLLVQASVGALGYSTIFLTDTAPNVTSPLSATDNGDGTYTLQNNSIYAVISESGITKLSASKDSASVFSTSAAGNQIVVYNDSGNIYRFAMEMPCLDGTFQPSSTLTFVPSSIRYTSGDLLVSVVVEGNVTDGKLVSKPYTISYSLYATDTALRISINGAAPSGTSVMVRFPFSGTPAELAYPTTAHWNQLAPRNFSTFSGNSDMDMMTFEPTHDFVGVVDANDQLLGAIYHLATPGWAIEPATNSVIGCILRNTPGGGNGASGSDEDAHTIGFAVTIPDGLQLPGGNAWGQGAILGAALDTNNSLAATAIPATGSGTLPASISIASTTDSRVLITAAKQGTVDSSQAIVRLYQPTNSAIDSVVVTFLPVVAGSYQSNGDIAAQSVTALEVAASQNSVTAMTATTVTVNLPYALSTIALGSS